jgi:glycerate 2-kinase
LTVTRRGAGIRGRNAKYALALALALKGAPGIHALACDTDGVDGAAEIARAIITPQTLARARALGADAAKSLGDQVITGQTLTNVNDFRALLIH